MASAFESIAQGLQKAIDLNKEQPVAAKEPKAVLRALG